MATRGPTFAGLATIIAALAYVTVAMPLGLIRPSYAGALLVLAFVLVVLSRFVITWRGLLAGLVLVILLIPIRRYSLPGHLPMKLEVYRLWVAVLATGWLGALLVDRRISARRSGFDKPLLLILGAYVASDIANGHRIAALGITSYVVKGLSFFISFVIVYYVVVSLTQTDVDLDFLIKVLVAGMAFVGFWSVVENRTRFNIFYHLHSVLPGLRFAGLSWGDLHDNRRRATGSAEHPIALGAGMAMILPFSLYLMRKTGQRRWGFAGVLLLLGLLSSRSRTGVVLLVVIGLVFLWLRPRQVLRHWTLLIPLLLAAQLAMPGLGGTLKNSFFPQGGLVAQQEAGAGTYGSGRLADLGPGIRDWKRHPMLGDGFASRIADRTDPHVNSPILDDAWLGTLLEAGIIGFLAWIVLFVTVIKRMGRAAKRDRTANGLLFVAVAAAVAAFAESMTTYDAFSFIQEVFILFFILAIGASALRNAAGRAPDVLEPAAL